MNGFLLDLRITTRSLAKTPGILFIALLTIALGVGVNTAMFSVIDGVLLQSLPYASPERIVAPWPEKRWSVTMVDDVHKRTSSFEAIAAYRTEATFLLGGERPEPIPVGIVSPSHFRVLGSSALMGRVFNDRDAVRVDGPVVVLSYGLWQRSFGGDRAIIGRSVRLTGPGSASHTVVGVMPEDFVPFPARAEAWFPMVAQGQPGYWGGYGMNVIARLKADVSVARASAELRGLVNELTPVHPTQFRKIRYSPVDVVPQLELMTRGVRSKLLILFAAVVFILLIACTNVANLLLARAHGRQREVAVQMAIGCSRGRVLRQVLSEGVVVGLVGGALGVAAAAAALPVLRTFAAGYIPRSTSIGLNASVLLFALLMSLVTGLLFGALPAVRAASTPPAVVMRATGGRGQSQGRGATRVNNVFVVTEIALSLLLLVGAGLMLKSLWQLTRVDLGYKPENVLTMRLTLASSGRYDSAASRAALLRELQSRISAVPGVATVGTIDALPLSGLGSGIPYRVIGQAQPEGTTSQVVSYRVVTPEYFEALGIPRLSGRTFLPTDVASNDSTAPGVILVNQAFAKLHWPDGNAIGARIAPATGNAWSAVVVGIVADSRQTSPSSPADPEIYSPASQDGFGGGFLVIRGARGVPQERPILDVIKSIDPDIGLRNIRPMEEVVRAGSNDTRFYTRLLTGFAVLAMLLGIVGVYGVMTHAISRRTREFGVRLALGATGSDVLRFVMTRAMAPVAIGLALGIGGALALTRLIAGLLFGVSPGDPWVLLIGAFVLGLAAAAAAFVPARRASRLSPLDAMRQE